LISKPNKGFASTHPVIAKPRVADLAQVLKHPHSAH
jgi:hypothetical protein